ncbi:hypothetical protein [Levilactobacillus parabrevis]|uniref:hypothetical protein n=1 Tax=Levilactobacillus parabrevis TaxID=357278 RepID=UPI0037572E64
MNKIESISLIILSSLLLTGCNTQKKSMVTRNATSSELNKSLSETLKVETDVYVAAIRGNGSTTKEMSILAKSSNKKLRKLNSKLKNYKASKKVTALIEYNNDAQALASAVLTNKSDKKIYGSALKANKQARKVDVKSGFHASKPIVNDYYASLKEYGRIYSDGSQRVITYPSHKTYHQSDTSTLHTLTEKYVYTANKDNTWNGANTQIDGVSITKTKSFTFTDNDNNSQTGNGIIMVNITTKANKDIYFYPSTGKLITNDGQQLDAARSSDSFGQIYSSAKKDGTILFYIPKLKNVNSIKNIRFVFDAHEEKNVLNSKDYSFNINLDK